ncbi:MAG: hypothetical protein EOM37_09140 [Proteobacteria bacterium]|jgi:hypothetical protein|nr:hypothetical protein [Alphaproteobacteria bacterium]NCC04188.1 hypothetical protein [Pseudomonadota bacterium]
MSSLEYAFVALLYGAQKLPERICHLPMDQKRELFIAAAKAGAIRSGSMNHTDFLSLAGYKKNNYAYLHVSAILNDAANAHSRGGMKAARELISVRMKDLGMAKFTNQALEGYNLYRYSVVKGLPRAEQKALLEDPDESSSSQKPNHGQVTMSHKAMVSAQQSNRAMAKGAGQDRLGQSTYQRAQSAGFGSGGVSFAPSEKKDTKLPFNPTGGLPWGGFNVVGAVPDNNQGTKQTTSSRDRVPQHASGGMAQQRSSTVETLPEKVFGSNERSFRPADKGGADAEDKLFGHRPRREEGVTNLGASFSRRGISYTP